MEHIGLYLKDIYFNKKSGSLIFKRKKILKYLFFQEGNLIFAKSNQQEELLGEILFKIGKLPGEVLERIEDYIVPKKKLGEVLIEKNLISKNDLRDGLSYQLSEIVVNMFSVFEGDFNFQEKEESIGEDVELKVDLSYLMEDGIRRMGYHSNLAEYLTGKTPKTRSRDFYYRLTRDERTLFDTIEGHVTTDALLKTKKHDEEPFWKTVYLLYCLGLIDLTIQGDVETEPPVQKPTAIGEQDKNLAEAMELSQNLGGMNHYQVLNVPSDANLEMIKQSYFELAKKYHPDLFDRNLPLEMRVSIEEVFDRITKAYKVLSDDQERKQYDKSQAKSEVPDQKDLQQRADLNYNRAVALFKRGKYDDARILLKEAVRLNSKKGSFYLLLAMAESKLSQYRREAEENFLKAIKLEPWNVDSYVGLGLMYKQEGLQVKAEKQFRMALKFDPENRTALKELRISRKDDKKKGLKDLLNIDIFGKKKD